MTFEVVGMSAGDQVAWQASLGLPITSRGSFSSAHWDVTIPSDALFMKIFLVNTVAAIASDKYLSAVFSSDGGSTFHTGSTDYQVSENDAGAGVNPFGSFQLGSGAIADFSAASPKIVEITVFPGSATCRASIMAISSGQYDGVLLQEFMQSELLAETARQTTMRFALAGDGSPHNLSADYCIQSF
jgi:hypothetical protein